MTLFVQLGQQLAGEHDEERKRQGGNPLEVASLAKNKPTAALAYTQVELNCGHYYLEAIAPEDALRGATERQESLQGKFLCSAPPLPLLLLLFLFLLPEVYGA